MYTVELLTPIGIIPISFKQKLKDKDGKVKEFIVPFVFKNEKEILERIEKDCKGKIYGYHVKLFIPLGDGKKLQ